MTIQLFVKKLRDDILHGTKNYLSVAIEALYQNESILQRNGNDLFFK